MAPAPALAAGTRAITRWCTNPSRSYNEAISELGGGIAWKHSYVTDDNGYCVYEADDPELLRRHGAQGGFPVNVAAKVRRTIDPSTAD